MQRNKNVKALFYLESKFLIFQTGGLHFSIKPNIWRFMYKQTRKNLNQLCLEKFSIGGIVEISNLWCFSYKFLF